MISRRDKIGWSVIKNQLNKHYLDNRFPVLKSVILKSVILKRTGANMEEILFSNNFNKI